MLARFSDETSQLEQLSSSCSKYIEISRVVSAKKIYKVFFIDI